MDVLAKLKELVALRAICAAETEITETTDLTSKQIDDVDWVALACDVEDELGIEVDYERFMLCKTVGEIKAYVDPLVEASILTQTKHDAPAEGEGVPSKEEEVQK
jgi:acyl carrier protein